MIKTSRALFVILIVAASSLACTVTIEGPTLIATPVSGAPNPTATTAPGQPTVAPTGEAVSPTQVPAPTTAPAQPTVPPDSGPAIPPASIEPKGESLVNLGTFRQKMTVKLTEASTGASGTYHYQADVNTTQPAMHVVLTAEGAGMQYLPSNKVEAIWIGTKLWIKVGNQPWLPVPESVSATQFDEYVGSIGGFLPYVPGAQKGGPDETINGILCHHWTYSVQNAQTEYGTVTGSGDIFTAVDGGYVVRYTLNGQATYQEVMVGTGTVNLVYDTYDVGANIVIQAPSLGR
ncbi:MAG: hypothetical protein KKB13_00525 [Chloroflexi bacterium]|nr:hypothetical protein [Chloroflexota bacterium]